MVEDHAVRTGYAVIREQHLRSHCVRTLETWAANLASKQDEIIAITSEKIYERFMKSPTGYADVFHRGFTDVCQFTCEKG